MKYGVVVCTKTYNIGDDIQSYAASRFLPKIDFWLDRECLDQFHSDETVATIMNGWFLHDETAWPPSADIYPLCISMHFNPHNNLSLNNEYLRGLGGDYLKHYGPVGCRDINTLKILENLSLEGYFSGCMTLTLPQQPFTSDKGNYICAVDLQETMHGDKILKHLKSSCANIPIRECTHNISVDKVSYEERFDNVEKLLKLYQNAKFVITSRLHCALPCLAMQVPVILILPNKQDVNTRFGTFLSYVKIATQDEICSGKWDYFFSKPTANSDIYMQIRNQLIEKSQMFINTCEMDLCLNPPLWSVQEIERLKFKTSLQAKRINEYEKILIEEQEFHKRWNIFKKNGQLSISMLLRKCVKHIVDILPKRKQLK